MATDIFSGDPALILNANGSSLVFKGGQPVMDQGLENLSLISLFTEPGWYGNVFLTDPDQQIGSNFMASTKGPITLTTLNNVRQAADKALENPAYGKREIEVSNPNSHNLSVLITNQPPGQDVQTLLLTRNGLNWLNQAANPASGRI